MRKINFCLTLMIALSMNALNANSISGKVVSENDEAVFYANVILFNALDSSIVNLQYTDEEGQFIFSDLKEGKYWIEGHYVGYPDLSTSIVELKQGAELRLDVLKFEEPTNELEEIVVKARRPLLELKPNKLVMNVEGSINASGEDAFSLLRKAPGVVIDNSDNIFMLGKGGVKVYFDGKPSPLNGTDLIEYLKSIPSSEIESIEIISHPSAKYEAEGNSGIINIKFRRDKNMGTSGNASVSARNGRTEGYSGNLRLTNRTKSLNTFGSLSSYYGEGWNPMSLYREQSGLIFDQNALGTGDHDGVNYRIGSDLLIHPHHTLGILISGSNTAGSNLQDSETLISNQGSNYVDSILVAQSSFENERMNRSYNFNYRFDNGAGKSLNLDLDHGMYKNEQEEYQPNTYYSNDREEILSVRDFANESPFEIKISTIKLDYEQQTMGGVLGMGFKLSRVRTDNTFNFYNIVNEERELDITRSNSFNYEENVNAAYASYSRNLNKLSINAGLRVEQTMSVGDLEAMVPTDNEKVERDYLDFFPSLGISYKMDEKNSFQLSYSRRLNRPSYDKLNPFRQRLDELTFEQGNPFLSPEYSTSYKLTHSWNYRLNTSVSYSHTSDLIARITDVEGDNYAFITYKNIADQYSYSLSVSAPIPITEWWSSYSSLTGVRTHNKADFGEGKLIDLKVHTFNIYSQHNFNLPKSYNIELSGWYNSPSIWEGNFKMESMYSIDLGVQKSLMNNNLNLKLSVSDVFETQKWTGVTVFGEQKITAKGAWDSRRVRLNVNYKFGNSNVKSRRRKLGLEDEERRIGGDS